VWVCICERVFPVSNTNKSLSFVAVSRMCWRVSCTYNENRNIYPHACAFKYACIPLWRPQVCCDTLCFLANQGAAATRQAATPVPAEPHVCTIRAHTHTNSRARVHARTNTHTHSHTHVRAYTRTYTYTHTHKHTYTYKHTHAHTHTHTYPNKDTNTHTYTHTHTHTHTHTNKDIHAHTHLVA